MSRLALTALAAAAILACAAPLTRAAPAAPAPAVRIAAIVCGGTGCNPVQTKSQKRRKFVPLQYSKPLPKTS